MTNRKYPLDQSPFYKLLGKKKLESLLQIELTQLDRLLDPTNYHVWSNKKGRQIQQPLGCLKQVHKRIGNLLSLIKLPDYVFSQKGHSYLDNTTQHIGYNPLGKTDIVKFYSSTTRKMVLQMFLEDFKCARDIANILTDICCYQKKHLPTGSPLSGYVAFLAAKRMFDEISAIVTEAEGRMSLYVDDITVSGPRVNRKLLSDIQKIVRQYGLKTNNVKTKVFSSHMVKVVTGIVVVGSEVRLPNSRYKKIWETRSAIREANVKNRNLLLRSLNGRLQEAKQILAIKTITN